MGLMKKYLKAIDLDLIISMFMFRKKSLLMKI